MSQLLGLYFLTYGYIVVYGGRRGMRRGEMEVRAARMRRYLVATRGLSSDRVAVAAGGFRRNLTVEFWIIPRGIAPPAATPWIDRRKVKFQKGNFDGWEEPGVFLISCLLQARAQDEYSYQPKSDCLASTRDTLQLLLPPAMGVTSSAYPRPVYVRRSHEDI